VLVKGSDLSVFGRLFGSLAPLVIFALGATLAGTGAATAMQFSSTELEASRVLVIGRGPIVSGDLDRLSMLARGIPVAATIIGFSFDSTGGSVLEAEKLANLIHRLDTTVIIGPHKECSSACFLLFAAAATRMAAPDALIGVHSASDDGVETIEAMAITTAMARDVSAYDVPASIIGKMVRTPADRAYWLTSSDLALMGVVMLREQPTPPPQVATSPSPLAPPNYAAARPPESSGAQPPPAFEQGLADRRAWETWFSSLSGPYREGAFYWSSQRSLPNPGSCVLPNGSSLGDWTNGCLAAQQRLAPSDARRRSEPAYRLGWNSY
jgi:hypothetical protein